MASSSNQRGARIERSPESFESLRKRNMAVEVLQSYEKLSWLSFARCESLQQTRLHCQNLVAGFSAQDEAALVEWPTDNTPIPNRNGDDDKPSRRRAEGSGAGQERSTNGATSASASNSALSGSPSNKAKEKASSRSGDSGSKKKRKSPAKG